MFIFFKKRKKERQKGRANAPKQGTGLDTRNSMVTKTQSMS